jgi:hypothetical protein
MLVVLASLGAAFASNARAEATGSKLLDRSNCGHGCSFKVPDGVYFLEVDVQGGKGGTEDHSGPGGRGSGVSGTLRVTPGQVLEIWVGLYGGGHGGDGYAAGGDHGTADGALNPCHTAAGGGGASAILAGGTPLVVAGGGGGGGGDCDSGWGGRGGDGGTHATAGQNANNYEPPNRGTGGCGGCGSGSHGEAGHNATYDESGGGGGGGGGGYNASGGGGGLGGEDGTLSWKQVGTGGGGGGGGSSLISGALTAAHEYHSLLGHDGQVKLSWGGAPATVTVVDGDGQATPVVTAFPLGLRAKVENADGVPLVGVPVTFAVPAGREASGSWRGTASATVTATTGDDGVAAAPPLTANAISGSWTAEATASGVTTPARFHLTNDEIATATTVLSSTSPSVTGQPVRFTAQVVESGHGTALAPTGLVQFHVDGAPLGEAVVLDPDGTAVSEAIDSLTPADHAVDAVYLGDPGHARSTGTLTQPVHKATTAVAVTSSTNPSGVGDAVSFTAAVTVQAPGVAVPTGTISFLVDGAPLGSPVAVDASGHATSAVTTGLGLGDHEITAQYSGDADLEAADAAMTQSVGPEATATELSTAANPVVYGSAVRVRATVRRQDPGTVLSGTVDVSVDGALVCSSLPLVADAADCDLPDTLVPGRHEVSAAYHGEPDARDSATTLALVVAPIATTSTVAGEPDPSELGTAVVLRATVAAPLGAPTPNGAVRFSVDGDVVGTATPLQDGVATLSLGQPLSFGGHVLEADYDPGVGFAPSHGSATQQVGPATTAVAVSSSLDPAPWGRAVRFAAQVSVVGNGLAPAGVVQFLVDGVARGGPVALRDGSATSEAVDGLAPGAHEVMVRYQGYPGFLAADGSVVQHVGPQGGGGGGGGGDDASATGGGSPGALEPAPLTPVPEAPTFAIDDRRVTVSPSGTLLLSVACRGPAGQRCDGRLVLRTSERRARALSGSPRHRPARVTLAQRLVSVPTGTEARVAVDLSRVGERVLSRYTGISAVATITATPGTTGTERRLRITSRRAPVLRVRGHAARVTRSGKRLIVAVSCAASRGHRCRGTLRVGIAHGAMLARRTLSVGPGRDRVTLRLTRAARERLRTTRRLRARAVATSTLRVGRRARTTATIVVRGR